MSDNASEAPAPVESSAPVESAEPAVEVVSDAPAEDVSHYDQFLADHAASEEAAAEESSAETVDGEPEAEAEAEAEPMYEIVVDGVAQQVPLEQLLKGYNTGTVSNKRFAEAAQKVKEAQDLEAKTQEWKERLIQNPYAALQAAGIPTESIRQHYEDVVYQWLQVDQMSDEEKAVHRQKKEHEEMQAKYAQMKQEMEEAQTRKEQEAFQATVAKQQEQILGQINGALDKVGAVKSPEAIRAIANNMKTAIESGYELSIDDAVALYKEETSSSLKSMISSLPEDALLGLIGQDRMNAIRKMDIEKLKNPVGLPKTDSVEVKTPAEKKDSATSFFDNLKKSTYKS